MHRFVWKMLATCSAAALLVAIATSVRAEDAAGVKRLFTAPLREYASAPLWVWNDMLTEDEVRSTLRDLASQKVRQAFVHPAPRADDALPFRRLVSALARRSMRLKSST